VGWLCTSKPLVLVCERSKCSFCAEKNDCEVFSLNEGLRIHSMTTPVRAKMTVVRKSFLMHRLPFYLLCTWYGLHPRITRTAPREGVDLPAPILSYVICPSPRARLLIPSRQLILSFHPQRVSGSFSCDIPGCCGTRGDNTLS
jgi:hypothetical protein